MNTTNQLPERLRKAITEIRRKPYPISDLIPLLSAAADALQARAQVQGEPMAWLHWLNGPVRVFMNKDGAMMELDRLNREYPVDSGDRKMRPLILGDTSPQPTQATQATPSIPSDGPSTYAQRFTAAVAAICGVTPPAALVCDWINKEERHDDLQQWVGSYAPGWVQNIAVLDAAHQMADQPTEGGNHEPAQQPATPASVQADSSEHLRVVASLGDALRRLSFAAQTTGGTDGPDAELQSAIGQAEQALSLGGIWQAMSATGEPVARSEREQLRHAQAAVVMPMIGPLLDAWENSDREVMSQEPELSKQLKNINSAMEDADTHPAPSVPDDVVHLRNALILAANRLDRLTLELKYDSQARADAIEWASDAMLAAKA